MEKKKIRIVDDEPTFTRMMRLVLEQTGRYEVCEENKGSQAMVTARLFKPDLILLDVVMPDMDGGDVAAQMQNDAFLKTVPVVFLTALVSERETDQGAVMRGGHRFLGKLVSDVELLECIENSLRK